MAQRTVQIAQSPWRTVKEWTCDICGKKVGAACRQCRICGRDVCGLHIYEAENGSDYPDVYCTECWEIGETRRKRMDDLEEEIEDELDQWHREARAAAKTGGKG